MDSHDLPLTPDPLLEHAGWIRKLALELVHDPGAADDLVQETWLAFLRAKPDTDRPLRPWLSRVVRNAAALRARRRAGQAAREAEVARVEETPSAHELVERAEQQQRLVRAVLDLDDPYRSTILLRYFEGLEPREIAAMRDVPSATVRTHLHRGLQQLRERLDEEHDGDRRAWVLLLEPLLPAPDPAVAALGGAGVLVGVVVTVLGLFGALALIGGDDRPAPAVAVGEVGGGSAPAHEPASVASSGARVPDRSVPPNPAAGARSVALFDARTGAALPGYLLRLDGREATSDADGRVALPAGATRAELVDHPDLAVERPASHARRVRERRAPERVELGGDGVLRVAAGPTFRVDLVRSPGVPIADLEARLVGEGLSEYGDDARPRELAPLREPPVDGALAWVRFGALPSGHEVDGASWRLEVRDRAGFAHGAAPLEEPAPLAAPVVEVRLDATAVVAGRVDGATGADRREAVVSLHREDDPRRVVRWTPLDEDGRFVLRWVEPGAYALRVTAPSSAPLERAVVLDPARRHEVDLALEPLTVAGPLAGTIESASGAYRGQLLVFLFQGERVLGVDPTTWRAGPDGRYRATFAFADVPEGELRLDVLSLADAVTFECTPAPLSAPDEAVTVRLLDEEPAADCGFEVTDAATGDPLERFEVEVRVDGGAPRRFLREPAEDGGPSWVLVAGEMRWNRFVGRAPLRGLPRAAEVTWTVRADGYLPLSGATAEFRYAEGDLRVARARLRRE